METNTPFKPGGKKLTAWSLTLIMGMLFMLVRCDREVQGVPTITLGGGGNMEEEPPPPPADQIHQQSFESTNGWALSHTFRSNINANNVDFAGRFTTGEAPGNISGDMESQVNGSYYIACEDTETEDVTGSPSNGVVFLTLDPVTITDKTNLRLAMLLAANDANDYDFHSRGNGDRVDILAVIDGTTNRIGFFTALSNASSLPLHQYTNVANDDIGTLGDEVPESGQDYEFAISGTGDSLVITIEVRMDAGREAVLIDNLRVLGD